MNLASQSEFSIYQLTQGLENSPQALDLSYVSLNILVKALIDLLIEQQLDATIWVKSPTNDIWKTEIEQYQSLGCAQKIYWCDLFSVSKSTPKNAPIVPIQLEVSSNLKHEVFFIVLSPRFCGAIVAQEKKVVSIEKRKDYQSERTVKVVCTTEPDIIKAVLQGIKQTIIITDQTPEELIGQSEINDVFPDVVNSRLLMSLLLKQIQYSETLQLSNNSSKEKSSIYLEKAFLNRLTGELLPLVTNMKTALRLLESKQTGDKRKIYLELLQKECDRQNYLINGLLELIELDKVLEEESEEPVYLEDLVPGIVSTYQPLAQEKGIILGYTIPAGFPSVDCPHSWVRNIILNLLSNSLKFTAAKGRVFVQAFLQNEYVELTFTDTGTGIPPREIPLIFNSFYRGSNATGEHQWSAGLGLTIVNEILHRCGGSISVNSTVGKGSIFRVLLPIDNHMTRDKENF